MVRSTSESNTYKFNFDRVFDPNSNQQEVYDFTAKNIVESVLEGFNGTIFAFGQTSSGKTHTMQGVIDNPEKEGIIPRMIRHLFNFIVNSSSDTEYIVKVSMIEIYMEKIKDLIDPERTNLNVREDKAKGIYIEDLSEHYVVSEDEVLDIMKLGSDNRSVAATNMNEHSSRSHSIFIMTIHQNNIKDLSAKTGKLYLVDLAGSEKISKTGATGLTLEEAKTINKSLTTLGMVINSLTDGKSTHIPYRESKLTRVLQESLGGNAKTCLIITCSPSIYNESESLSTLRFGLRAKKIKNKPKINKETTVAELKIEIDRMDKTILKLNWRIKQLENYIVKNGLPIPLEDEPSIENDIEVDRDREVTDINIRDDLELMQVVNLKTNNHNGHDDGLQNDHVRFDDLKVSFGNLNQDNMTNLVINDKISRLTGGFGTLINKSNFENEKIFANGNFEQLTKMNNEYSNKIKELEEENKTLNEQIEFLHEFISRLDKELEFKSNTIENLEIINKKIKEELDDLKCNPQNMRINKMENQILEERKRDIIDDRFIENYEENDHKDDKEKNKIIEQKGEDYNEINRLSGEKFDEEIKNCSNEYDNNLEIEKKEKKEEVEFEESNYNYHKTDMIVDKSIEKLESKKNGFSLNKDKIIDLEEEKLNLNFYLKSENLTNERLSNCSFTKKTNKIQYDNLNSNIIFDRSSVLIKSEPKRRSILNDDSENIINHESYHNKSADKEDGNKKDFTLLEIFQKLKQEKKITKSTNFFQLENILSNSINNHEVTKKTIGCQTEFSEENQDENKSNIENVINTEENLMKRDELYIRKIDNNSYSDEIYKEEENIDRVDFKDFIFKIQNLKEKIQIEKNLIDNIYNTKINTSNVVSEKDKFSREENKIDNIVSQLDLLVKEFKEHTNKLNSRSTFVKDGELNARQTLNSKEKFSQSDLDELQKKIYSELEYKMFEEKRKNENEKKTILKVLEEKCERFNIFEIENGDLKSKIRSLEVKMSPDEKINKRILVKLEQNIEQLNLMLEKTVAEKSQFAINLKVICFFF